MIILQDAKGNQRFVPEGVEYRPFPGEKVVGSTLDQDAAMLETELDHSSEGKLLLGNIIQGVIKSTRLDKLLGKTNCSSCERRRLILNMAKELGFKETARRLVETFNADSELS